MLLFVISVQLTFGQNFSIISKQVDINTINSLDLVIRFGLNKNINDRKTAIDVLNQQTPIILEESASGDKLFEEKRVDCFVPSLRNIEFKFNLEDTSLREKFIALYKKEQGLIIRITENIKIYSADSSDTLIITPQMMVELSADIFGYNETIAGLIENYNDGDPMLIKNSIDVGTAVNTADSTKTDFTLNFDFLQNVQPIENLFVNLKGHVSTDELNPHNRIEAFLLYKLNSAGLDLYAEAGRDGPQDFKHNMWRGQIFMETLLPFNLLNLSQGHGRLRLFPYIKAGVGYHSNNFNGTGPFEDDEEGMLAFFETYYYIPVLDKYGIIFESEGTYSEAYEGDNKFKFTYSVVLGYELPLEDFKAMLKLESGESQVWVGRDTKILLGLLLSKIPFN